MLYPETEESLDEMIVLVEEKSLFRCPKESKKNIYTKTCWLMYIHKKFLKIIGTSDSSYEEVKGWVKELGNDYHS